MIPQTHQQLILGIPWLKQENPHIDWRLGQVSVERNGHEIFLPCRRQGQMDNAEEECLWAICSKKAFQQEMKNQSQAFVGILRVVKSKDVEGHHLSW